MDFLKRRVQRLLMVPAVRYAVDLAKRFGDDNGSFYAAGLAFFLLLSFVPILLTGVAILSSVVNAHAAAAKVTEIIQSLLPVGGARDEMTEIISTRFHLDEQVKTLVQHRGIAGVLGFLSLLWATMQIFINASIAMNATWEVKETRNWFVVRGIALVLLMTTGSLSVISLLLTSAPPAIEAFQLPVINHLPLPIGVLTFVLEIVALLINGLMYVLIYKLLPNAKVSWLAAGIGGVAASVLYEIAKTLIARFLLRPNHSIYGDLANLILFILWIYYSMTILLLGAEITASVARLSKPNKTVMRKRVVQSSRKL